MCYFCHNLKHNPTAPAHLSKNCRNRLNTYSTHAQKEYKSFLSKNHYACYYCYGLDYCRYVCDHKTTNCTLKGNPWSSIPESKKVENHSQRFECSTCGVCAGEMGMACECCIMNKCEVPMHCWQHCSHKPKHSSKK